MLLELIKLMNKDVFTFLWTKPGPRKFEEIIT